MKTFDIWSEGYVATGGFSGAIYLGSVEANSFKEACDIFAKTNQKFSIYYDPERMTYWGCRLFDNESDARKSFG